MAEFDVKAKQSPSANEGAPVRRRSCATLQDNRASSVPVQRKAGASGLPEPIKGGIEALSGMSIDHVHVHYNLAKPAQLQALAYAQGSDIHLGPGQERHLPHEAWHIVQQAQGRVRPTMQMKDGVPVNNNPALENEADEMGAKASAAGSLHSITQTDNDVLKHRSWKNGPVRQNRAKKPEMQKAALAAAAQDERKGPEKASDGVDYDAAIAQKQAERKPLDIRATAADEQAARTHMASLRTAVKSAVVAGTAANDQPHDKPGTKGSLEIRWHNDAVAAVKYGKSDPNHLHQTQLEEATYLKKRATAINDERNAHAKKHNEGINQEVAQLKK